MSEAGCHAVQVTDVVIMYDQQKERSRGEYCIDKLHLLRVHGLCRLSN